MTSLLVVDDHEVVRRGLRSVLLEAFPGASVGEAASADEALRLLQAEPPQVVILDINLPGKSGLDLLGEARRRWPRLPVLVLSAYPEEEFAVRCFTLGAVGYLAKGGAADELVVAVRRVLEGGRYVSPAMGERLAGVLGGATAAPHETLSARELQVLRLVALGRTLKEIAQALDLSEKTVGTYRARLAVKLGLSSNVEIARYALKHRLVD